MSQSLTLSWAYLPVAFALGGLHALEPGHGKSLASAYLVSGKHTWRDAIVLGVATTFSHTSVVVFLALASLSLKGFFEPGQLEHLIGTIGSGILILVGAWTSQRSLKDIRHGHGHSHGHSHGHPESKKSSDGLWGVALIGISNGVLPCPGALAALLVALSLGQVALGLVTVLTYSLGLAMALAIMGILVVEAGRRAKSWLPSDKSLQWLPLASGALVLGTGIWLLLFR